MPRQSLLALWFGIALSGCWVRDSGHDFRPTTGVHAEALCGASEALSGCPACSRPDGALCLDRFYDAAERCSRDDQCTHGHCDGGYCVYSDRDNDGLDDDFEQEIAARNLPSLLYGRYEQCGMPRAIVYRVRRHPALPRRISVVYVVLYDRDCGVWNGHLGDNEAFAITVDLDEPPGPLATVGVMAEAHRNTGCQSLSTCAAAPGTGACAFGGPAIAIHVSADKHANYLDADTCFDNCFDVCGAERGPSVALIDVGQPDAPLSRDLTAEKFLIAADGWEPGLLHFDPWSQQDFGGAGAPRDQLLELLAPPGP